jgi:hypothetical protein
MFIEVVIILKKKISGIRFRDAWSIRIEGPEG